MSNITQVTVSEFERKLRKFSQQHEPSILVSEGV